MFLAAIQESFPLLFIRALPLPAAFQHNRAQSRLLYLLINYDLLQLILFKKESQILPVPFIFFDLHNFTRFFWGTDTCIYYKTWSYLTTIWEQLIKRLPRISVPSSPNFKISARALIQAFTILSLLKRSQNCFVHEDILSQYQDGIKNRGRIEH